MEEESSSQKSMFPEMNADDPSDNLTQIESLCMNCQNEGLTKLLLTTIPYFREVIVSSFECEECGFTNRNIQAGGKIQDKGVRYEITIQHAKDLNRQVVKSESGVFSIPCLEFEQPAAKGEINTVEGLIDSVIRGLAQEQPVRKVMDPEVAEKIDNFMGRLENLKKLSEPFNIVLDDPSGNSFVENPLAPNADPASKVEHYNRTVDHDKALGLMVPDDSANAEGSDREQSTSADGHIPKVEDSPESLKENLKDEVLQFATNCSSCNAPVMTNMKLVDIPFFKEVIIMATSCDVCGHRDSEVKSGTGVEDKGVRITLNITDPSDLNRDLLKSDTCGVKIPEVELELSEGTLGGRFTTVEGLLLKIKEELQNINPFVIGDSATPGMKEKLQTFLAKLSQLTTGQVDKFTLILDDPAGNSYLQNTYAPDPDPEMKIEHYERTAEQDDDLGLLHMKTENYTSPS